MNRSRPGLSRTPVASRTVVRAARCATQLAMSVASLLALLVAPRVAHAAPPGGPVGLRVARATSARAVADLGPRAVRLRHERRALARRVVGTSGSPYTVRTREVWSADRVHELRAQVHVAAGGTLIIEAGTRVEGRPGSSLTIDRDGRLEAIGTATEPIEFTCTSVPRYEGCWGGLTVLGNATINHGQPLSPPARGVGAGGCLQATVGVLAYGGCADTDSSGVLRFARIEYARDGLQLLGVGSQTLVEFVQVNRSRGNGVTVNGGTVGVRRLFLTANRDFGLAWYGGWIGRGQFITIHQDGLANRGGMRGSNAPAAGGAAHLATPRSHPTLFHVTIVSPSAPSNPHHASQPAAVVMAEGTSGTVRNVLLYAPNIGFDLRDEATCNPFDGTSLSLRHLLVAGAGSVGSPDADPSCDSYTSPTLEDQWIANPDNASLVVTDPAQVAALQSSVDLVLPDLRPAATSLAASMPGDTPPSDGFFDGAATFIGSVAPAAVSRSNIPFYAGWTSPAPALPPGGQVVGVVGAPPRGPFAGVTVASASGVSSPTSVGGDYALSLSAGTHALGVTGLPGECAAAATTVHVSSGATANVPIPVSCTAISRIVTAPFHACASTVDGRTLCWGRNDLGNLGTGDTVGPSSVPVSVQTPLPLSALTAGYNHSCGLGPGGVPYCWGLNAFAALGVGSIGGSALNPVVPSTGGVVFASIAAGGYHTCGLTAAGETWCWGWNAEGQTGIGAVGSPVILPQRVADGGLRFVQLTAGDSHTCALTAAGAAFCWGGNARGELGDDPAVVGTERPTPFAVPGGHVFVQIDAGRTHTCGVTTAGQALCWGERDAGQTGDGMVGGITVQPTPVSGSHTFASVSAGSQTTCGVTTASAAYCWGRGDGGLLGNGTTSSAVPNPMLVSGALTVSEISVSLASGAGGVVCARTLTGVAWCWGAGEYGQRGDAALTPIAVIPVAVRLPPPF
jgi:alpha-tubulin suppressor-like RCC1 family protein